jgi:hypothetical protein
MSSMKEGDLDKGTQTYRGVGHMKMDAQTGKIHIQAR